MPAVSNDNFDWTVGYTSSYHGRIVDEVTWADRERFEILSGSVQRNSDNDLKESATISCTDFETDREYWIRVYLDGIQADDKVHIPIFTGLASSPSYNINGTKVTRELQCYSVLKPAEDVYLPPGWFVLKDSDAVSEILKLLQVTPATKIVESSLRPTLDKTLVSESGETNLSMVLTLLKAIKWRLQINGHGDITLSPQSLDPVYRLDTDDNDIIEVNISVNNDWFKCPNVFRAVQDDIVAIAKDERKKEDSKFSIEARGREIWMEESFGTLSNDETVAEYAQRRLQEEQESAAMTVSYTRRYLPDVTIDDTVNLHLPAQGIQGDFQILSQSIDLKYSAKTKEEAKFVSRYYIEDGRIRNNE